MLRVAIPNKGGLAPASAQMLREAGYRQRADDKDLTCRDLDNDVEFFYLRPRDIAIYVASGDLDLGITGRDLLIDTGADVEEVLDLGFGALHLPVRGQARHLPDGGRPGQRAHRHRYPGVVTRFLRTHGISAEVIRLDGAVENAVGLGVADVIADVVDTGTTLRKAGLEPIGELVLTSSAVLIRRSAAPGNGPVSQLVRRLQGVLVARRYVMMDYDVPTDRVDAAVTLTPGHRVADRVAAAREGWVAVRAMVLRAEVHQIMDELYDLGARAILVTDIHACRL